MSRCSGKYLAVMIGAVAVLSGCEKDEITPSTGNIEPAKFDASRIAHRTILPQAMVSGKAMSGFVGYVLTIPKTPDNPDCRLSDRALREASFTIKRFVPNEGITTSPLGEIIYQSVVDKATAANLGYLAATVSVSDSDVAEVIVEDAFEQSVDPAQVDFAALTALEQQRDPNRTCGLYFVNRAFLTTVKSRTFSRQGGEAQFQFAVNIGGKRYVSTTNFTAKTELAIDARPLSTLIQTVVTPTSGGPDTVQRAVNTAVATMVLTAPDLPDTSSARLPKVVRLPSGWYDKRAQIVREAVKK